MDRGFDKQTWGRLEAHEDTSIQGPEGPMVGANGWAAGQTWMPHSRLRVMEVGWEGLSHKLIYPPSLEGLRELETKGKTKTEPGKGGPDRFEAENRPSVKAPRCWHPMFFQTSSQHLARPAWPFPAPDHPISLPVIL